MKKSKLKEYIKEIILAELSEVNVKEATYAGAGAIAAFQKDPKFTALKDKISPISTLKAGGAVTLENEEEPTEAEIEKEESLAKTSKGEEEVSLEDQTEFTKIAKELKANVGKVKAIVAKKPTERTKEEEMLLTKMKKLTQRKNQLKTKFSKFSKLEDED